MSVVPRKKTVEIANFFCKFIMANILTVVVLSYLCFFYDASSFEVSTLDGRPIKHNTPNSYVFNMREGHTYGKLDANGFNNLYYLERQIPIPNSQHKVQPHTLLIGSSQIAAFQMPMDKNCGYLINKTFESKEEPLLLYNIGYFAQLLVYIVDEYKGELEYFQPSRYAIIETMFLPIPTSPEHNNNAGENNQDVKEEKVGVGAWIKSKSRSLYSILEYAYVLRLLCSNLHTVHKKEPRKDLGKEREKDESVSKEENVVCLRRFLEKISEPSHEYGVQPILFYHPHTILNSDGSVSLNVDPRSVDLYRSECEKQGIVFLYLGDRFMREYEENNVLPYGFWNTLPNTGHLNKDGHRMIADELCKVIERLEKERKEAVQ